MLCDCYARNPQRQRIADDPRQYAREVNRHEHASAGGEQGEMLQNRSHRHRYRAGGGDQEESLRRECLEVVPRSTVLDSDVNVCVYVYLLAVVPLHNRLRRASHTVRSNYYYNK